MTGGTGKSKGPVRCAIYTRKSTSEGLDSDFNTLDAQREAAEHYVRSQAAEGWAVLPEHYDDGGFTGGNIERPARRNSFVPSSASSALTWWLTAPCVRNSSSAARL